MRVGNDETSEPSRRGAGGVEWKEARMTNDEQRARQSTLQSGKGRLFRCFERKAKNVKID
jgi:hypothetical protein